MTTLVTVGKERDYPGHVPTGPVGRRLVPRLLAAAEPARVLVSQEEATNWPPGADVVVGDVAQPEESSAVFEGVDRVFLAGAVPETVHQAVTLAKQGGVQRIVVLSSHGPEIEVEFTPESWYWLAVEVVVERSGAQWTHLRPSPIMAQTLEADYPDTGSDMAAAIRNQQVVHVANLDDPYPLIDEDDLAAVAMAALFEEQYASQALTVHGEPISLRQQLDLIGQTLGREIPVEELTPEEAAERFRSQGMIDEEVGEWLANEDEGEDREADLEYQRWVVQGIATLTRVLGRPPRSYADWLAEHGDAFR